MRNALIVGLGTLALVAPSAASAKAADANHDRIPDRWEKKYDLSMRVDQARRDQDKDGLTNLREYRAGTNPRKRDTDGDGVSDAREDADRDGIPNGRDEQPATPKPAVKKPAQGDDAPAADNDGAPAATPVIVSYTQGSGFGGVLVIQGADGRSVSS